MTKSVALLRSASGGRVHHMRPYGGHVLALLICAALPFPSSARSAEPMYDWTTDRAGVVSAEQIVLKCLDQVEDGQPPYPCIPKAIAACVTQYDNGSQNQIALTICNGYSAFAWKKIVDDVYERLMKSGAAPKDMARSQSMWNAWSKLDCAAISDYDGTRASMDRASCVTKHSAERVFDLTVLLPH